MTVPFGEFLKTKALGRKAHDHVQRVLRERYSLASGMKLYNLPWNRLA